MTSVDESVVEKENTVVEAAKENKVVVASVLEVKQRITQYGKPFLEIIFKVCDHKKINSNF